MDLWNYFTTNTGKKITKWKHYFPIYEKHFEPIRNKPIKILEIGILNGGSLEMWRYYFPEATIVGIDINPVCKDVFLFSILLLFPHLYIFSLSVENIYTDCFFSTSSTICLCS